MSSPHDPDSLRAALLHLINDVLPALQSRPAASWQRVDAHTSLFESGRLDSLSVLHLIAVIEESTGAPVPDALVIMKHFQTIDTIVETFCHECAVSQ
jgi:acyl carrier protein